MSFHPELLLFQQPAEVRNIRNIVEPVMVNDPYTSLLYIDMSRDKFKTGGSCFAQVLNKLGDEAPTVNDPAYFAEVFNTIQDLIDKGKILVRT